MATAKAAKEPSMEEILASIRQIIAEDDAPAPTEERSSATNEPGQSDIDEIFNGADEGEDSSAVDEGEDMSVDDIDSLFDSPTTDDAEEDGDVLDLSAEQAIADDDDIGFSMDDEEEEGDDLVFEVGDEPDEPEEVEAPTSQEPPETLGSDPLLSEAAAHSVKNAFGSLEGSMVIPGDVTLDALMREMLRPMLKSWLDENLPPLVEKVVREEIKSARRR